MALSTISGVGAGSSGTILTTGTPQSGGVIQVVSATYSTETFYTTSTLTDTGLTATITPKFATSKILVLVHQNGIGKDSGNTYERVMLVRNSTQLGYIAVQANQTNSTAVIYAASASTSYLDSPATTSATTYKTQISSGANVANVYAQIGGAVSTITLMEIAA
jgi:hypothetical protein